MQLSVKISRITWMENKMAEELKINPVRHKFAESLTRLIEIQTDLHEMQHAHMSELEQDAFVEYLNEIECALGDTIAATESLVQEWYDLLVDFADEEL